MDFTGRRHEAKPWESTSGSGGRYDQSNATGCLGRRRLAMQKKEGNAKDSKGKKVKERKGKDGKECKRMQWKGERCKCIQCMLRRTPTTPPPGLASCGRHPADIERERAEYVFGPSSTHALVRFGSSSVRSHRRKPLEVPYKTPRGP